MDPRLENVKTAELSRYFTVTTCYKGKKCSKPVAKKIAGANVEIFMAPFSKGYTTGWSGADVNRMVHEAVLFTSEIRITQKKDADDLYVYAMVRSGSTKQRNGKVKTFSVKDLSKMKKLRILDEPIPFKGGVLKVGLVLGPKR